MPWSIDPRDINIEYTLLRGFKNTTEDVPIPLDVLEREYCQLTDQPYPIKEMVFARSWMLFRVHILSSLCHIASLSLSCVQLSIISQGIAARFARRQASSEKAGLHGKVFPIIGQLARKVLEDEGHDVQQYSKSKL